MQNFGDIQYSIYGFSMVSVGITFCVNFCLYTSEGDLCINVKHVSGICSRTTC